MLNHHFQEPNVQTVPGGGQDGSRKATYLRKKFRYTRAKGSNGQKQETVILYLDYLVKPHIKKNCLVDLKFFIKKGNKIIQGGGVKGVMDLKIGVYTPNRAEPCPNYIPGLVQSEPSLTDIIGKTKSRKKKKTASQGLKTFSTLFGPIGY